MNGAIGPILVLLLMVIVVAFTKFRRGRTQEIAQDQNENNNSQRKEKSGKKKGGCLVWSLVIVLVLVVAFVAMVGFGLGRGESNHPRVQQPDCPNGVIPLDNTGGGYSVPTVDGLTYNFLPIGGCITVVGYDKYNNSVRGAEATRCQGQSGEEPKLPDAAYGKFVVSGTPGAKLCY